MTSCTACDLAARIVRSMKGLPTSGCRGFGGPPRRAMASASVTRTRSPGRTPRTRDGSGSMTTTVCPHQFVVKVTRGTIG